MTRDEAKNILGENSTEEQVTEFLNKFHTIEKGKDEKITELSANLSKYSDYDTIKNKLNELETKSMTEQQILEIQKKEIEENLRKSKIIVNKARAKEILAGLDIDDEIIDSFVTDDENVTITKITNFAKKINSIKEETSKKAKEEILTLDVMPNMSNVIKADDNKMTWDKFSNLSSDEQSKFADEHPEEFENL